MVCRQPRILSVFSIYRSDAAVTPLRQTWETADEVFREMIVQATFAVNRRLHLTPHEQGESRGDETRILFEGPLGVIFKVDEDRQIVHVLRTWAFRPVKSSLDGQG
jgi:hypothetical protein